MAELLDTERELLAKIAETEGWAEGYTVERSSTTLTNSRAYDLHIAGKYSRGGMTDMSFRAWLPLSAIHAVDWTMPAIWELSDAYGGAPPPPMEQDWSGIRDSSPDVQWEMFEIARRKLMGSTSYDVQWIVGFSNEEIMAEATKLLGRELTPPEVVQALERTAVPDHGLMEVLDGMKDDVLEEIAWFAVAPFRGESEVLPKGNREV